MKNGGENLHRFFVGVTRFELATLRPPDVYSNRTELHPELQRRKGRNIFDTHNTTPVENLGNPPHTA